MNNPATASLLHSGKTITRPSFFPESVKKVYFRREELPAEEGREL